jgi:hypothetical protein
MAGASTHTTNAHGLIMGKLRPQANGEDVQQLVDAFVHSQPLVDKSIVSLFEDAKKHGTPGDTIAVQADLKIPASNPQAHAVLEAIQNYMAGLSDFKTNSVEHY